MEGQELPQEIWGPSKCDEGWIRSSAADAVSASLMRHRGCEGGENNKTSDSRPEWVVDQWCSISRRFRAEGSQCLKDVALAGHPLKNSG